MKKNTISLLSTFFLFAFTLSSQPAQDSNVGAVIVAALEGKVSVLKNNDDQQGTEAKPGDVIPLGKMIVTGSGSKLTLLLSNGTLVTLVENTRMTVGKFEQTPFESEGKKVSDLQAEPSNSKVDLDLDMGSVVLKTKKLNKRSSFNINSPVGTAGIRGTEFQMGFDPSSGVQLDVTESTVDFTPPGGQPVPVTQGQGLDVSPSGQVAPRPVNPTVAQNISTTNQAATEVSADISMDSVSEAVTESTELSKEAEADNQEDSESKEESKEESQEEPAEDSQEEAMEESDEAGDEKASEPEEPSDEPSSDTEEPAAESDEPTADMEESTNETQDPATETEDIASETQDDATVAESTEPSTDTGEATVSEETMAAPVDQPAEQETTIQETATVDLAPEDTVISEPTSSTPQPEASFQETLPSVELTPEPMDTPDMAPPPSLAIDDFGLQAPKVEIEIKIEEIIERNPDAKQVQETGKMGAPASELAKLSLDGGMLDQYRDLPEDTQKELLNVGEKLVEKILSVEEVDPVVAVEFVNLSPNAQELAVNLDEKSFVTLLSYEADVRKGIAELELPVAERLLSMEEFEPELAAKFVGFSPEAQDLTLGLEDIALVTLLEQSIDEGLILSALTPESIEQSSSENIPTDNKAAATSEEVLSLGDNMRESGNADLYDEVYEMADGEITEEWVKVAEVAEALSGDVELNEDSLPASSTVSGLDALGNPFFQEISSLYDVLLDDGLLAGNDPSVIGGDIITMSTGSYDLSESLGDASTLLLGASESFTISGDLRFFTSEESDPQVIIMSGNDFSPASGSSITNELSDLVIATRGNVLLNDARLESVREIAIRALADVELQNVDIRSESMVRITAAQDLNVDGLQLSQSLPSLIMEATTIRLSNIDFPAATQVQLNSLKGPIDMKYPNFGTSIPQAQQIGRVNFLDNVKSGGNLIMDRSAFDQFGGNVNIGKLP
jgi:hypothetical protein